MKSKYAFGLNCTPCINIIGRPLNTSDTLLSDFISISEHVSKGLYTGITMATFPG
ncbi:hypothetical protein ADIARSV_1754 [Arcticibacter svalbardensis MN12-7]|uniref:Uncharacterized protein n=1 Tax=Arcticibacter svalbardensis MN12-7 TaxID=1150600 RepID=R9H1G0_9SPHI|nr:hypothetical protein ADIARSV_1754 [Arcticibacter svalbardensis MN12-7]